MKLCPNCHQPSMDQRAATQEGRCRPCRNEAHDPNRNKQAGAVE